MARGEVGYGDSDELWDTFNMSLPVRIDTLSTEERLRLIEQLWESLRTSPEAIPLTESQRAELDRRLDELDRGDVEGIPWDEVLRRIKNRPS